MRLLVKSLMRKCGSTCFLVLVSLLAAICLTPAQAVPGDDVPALQYFPLLKGSVWTYQGKVKRNLSTILRHSGQSFTVQKTSSTRFEEAADTGLLIHAAVGTSGGFGRPLGNRSGWAAYAADRVAVRCWTRTGASP